MAWPAPAAAVLLISAVLCAVASPFAAQMPDQQGRQVLLRFDLLTEILHCDLSTTDPRKSVYSAHFCESALGAVEHNDFDFFLYFWSSFLNLGYTSLRLA